MELGPKILYGPRGLRRPSVLTRAYRGGPDLYEPQEKTFFGSSAVLDQVGARAVAPRKRSQAAPFVRDEFVHGLRFAGEFGEAELVKRHDAAARHFVPQHPQTAQSRLVEIQIEVEECEAQAGRVLDQSGNRFAHIAFHHVDPRRDRRVFPVRVEVREERLAVRPHAARLHVAPRCLRFIPRIDRGKTGERIEPVEPPGGDAVEALRRIENLHQTRQVEKVRAVPDADLGDAPRHFDGLLIQLIYRQLPRRELLPQVKRVLLHLEEEVALAPALVNQPHRLQPPRAKFRIVAWRSVLPQEAAASPRRRYGDTTTPCRSLLRPPDTAACARKDSVPPSSR